MTHQQIPSGTLARKLQHFADFSVDDRMAVADATGRCPRIVKAHQDIISEGDVPAVVNVVLSGWACCHKRLEDGRRQIIAFFVPGDVIDLNIFVLHRMHHCVTALTPVRLAELSREMLDGLALRQPRVLQALWWDMLVASAIQREWIVNIGRRLAAERVGHLLLELLVRMQAVGLAENGHCDMPLTQGDLASATGLSSVHVNRSLQELRSAGLIVLAGRKLWIPDQAALRTATHFNPNYLHLRRKPTRAT